MPAAPRAGMIKRAGLGDARNSLRANSPAVGSSGGLALHLQTPQLFVCWRAYYQKDGVDPKARRDFWNEIHGWRRRDLTVLVSTPLHGRGERCHRRDRIYA